MNEDKLLSRLDEIEQQLLDRMCKLEEEVSAFYSSMIDSFTSLELRIQAMEDSK